MPQSPTMTRTGFGGMPKPRGTILVMLILMFFIWVTCALALNYGGASEELLTPFLGSTHQVLHGQLWRLVTAAFFNVWSGDYAVSPILTTLLILYFFGPSLEDRWGWRKMLGFLLGPAAFGFLCQTIVALSSRSSIRKFGLVR